jgi:hypothetical protein
MPKSKSIENSSEKAAEQGIRNIVGDHIYTVWLEMLHYLVPNGRTHRLSVLVASFLQYAAFLASNKWGNKEPPRSMLPRGGSVGLRSQCCLRIISVRLRAPERPGVSHGGK